jgi:hypothetical protein
VPYGHTSDDASAVESEQKGRWHVIGRKIHAALALFEDCEIAREGHALLVAVKEVRNFR